MAKYDVTKSCGHIQTHQIYGTNTRGQREYRAAQLAKSLCGDCARQQRTTLADRAATVATSAGWPTLTGSPTQIAWAQTLRADAVADLARELGDSPRVPDAIRDQVIDLYVRVAVREASAAWWIDRLASRYVAPRSLDARTVHARMTEADRAELAELRQAATRDDDEPTTPATKATAPPAPGPTPTAGEDPAHTIAALRAAGRTVWQIATTIGCAVSTVYRWARGIHRPSARYAAALAAIA